MIAFLLRRLAFSALVVFAVSFVSFCAFGLSLDPAYPLLMSPNHQMYRIVVAGYHLHDPILVRYWLWLSDVVHHHGFGSPVSLAIRNTIPPTIDPAPPIGPPLWHAVGISAQLVGFALVLVVVASVLIGAACAWNRGSLLDLTLRLSAYASWSLPVFVIAYVLAKYVAGHPSYGGPEPSQAFVLGPPGGGVVDWFRHMTLPACALALGLIGVYARYLRSALLVNVSEQYATVARGKGLSEGRIVRVHALRNSLIPFVSSLALEIGAVVGASLAADWIFGLGGLASFTIQSLGRSDPFTLTAIVVTLSAFVMAFVTVADLLVAWFDPRARILGGAV
ncbi:MAG: ABC transporter permease [Actinomycetota bacterium]